MEINKNRSPAEYLQAALVSTTKLNDLAKNFAAIQKNEQDAKNLVEEYRKSLLVHCNTALLENATVIAKKILAEPLIREILEREHKKETMHCRAFSGAASQIFISLAEEASEKEPEEPWTMGSRIDELRSKTSKHLALVVRNVNRKIDWGSVEVKYCFRTIDNLNTINWDGFSVVNDFTDWSILTALLYFQTEETAILLLAKQFAMQARLKPRFAIHAICGLSSRMR